jgi:multisite-specific tRNA:(cytosine-C5)-methyltransferase
MEKIEGEYEPTEQIKVQKIDWYPNMLVYSINTTKQQFKKSKTLEELHSYIEKASDVGLVTRQELVSMIPPLFLGIQSTDMVLDMCAAPGSKTSQML